MRLPADGRRWLETGCRIAAFAVLALLVFRALRPPTEVSGTVRTIAATDLVRATRDDPSGPLHFALEGMPTRTERAWQRALAGAGSEISWSGQLVPMAIAARPVNSPLGGHTVSVSAPPGQSLFLRDDISSIDSLAAGNGIVAIPVTVGSGNIRAVARRDSAFMALPDSADLHRILVFGKAGWETKFLVTALEESGWSVDANISVAPNVLVSQGSAAIDTANYSGIIALDETAATRAREISAFVRTGGGLVLGPGAARSDAFAALRISQPRLISQILNPDDSVSHSSARFASLQLAADAIPIERHSDGVSVAAKRVGFGRVLQVAYSETWRWRLQGNTTGRSEHSEWWTQLLSQTVHAARSTSAQPFADAAPYADLVNTAGAAVPAVRSAAPLTSRSGQVMWLMLCFAFLLVEWASRRLRGAR